MTDKGRSMGVGMILQHPPLLILYTPLRPASPRISTFSHAPVSWFCAYGQRLSYPHPHCSPTPQNSQESKKGCKTNPILPRCYQLPSNFQ